MSFLKTDTAPLQLSTTDQLPVRDIANAALADPLLFQSGKMAGLGKVSGRCGPRFQSFKGSPGLIQMDFWCKKARKNASTGGSPVSFPCRVQTVSRENIDPIGRGPLDQTPRFARRYCPKRLTSAR